MSTTTATSAKRWGARSIVSLLLFVLATVLLIPALVGHWGHRTVIDGQRYIETVGPLIEQPEIQQALAESVTDAVVARVDTQAQVDTLLGNLFPDAGFTDQLAAPIAAGINSLIGDLVARFVASDQFATVWIELNTAAQRGVVLVLEGKEGGAVFLRGDELILDTSSALTAIQAFLVDNGITAAANISIPETDREIVLAETPALAQLRTLYGFTSPILQWFPVVIALMFGGAVLLARRRARTVVAAGVVFAVSGVLLLIGLGIGQTTFTNQLAGTPWGPATDVFWNSLLEYLIAGTQAIVALGVVLILAGWFGGRTRLAHRLRDPLGTGLDDLRGRLFDGGSGPLPTAYAGYAAWGAYALGVLILLVSDLMSVSTVLWVSALVAGLVTAIQLASASGAAPAVPSGADSGGGDATTETPVSGSTTIE
jgi:hypothetical protein